MRMLRKLVGTKRQFRYVAEYTELHSYGQTKIYEKDIHSRETNARRTNGFAYEYYNPIHQEWIVISDIKYLNILNKHKTKSVVRRNAKVDEINASDVFDLSKHFEDRMYERFLHSTTAVPAFLNYIFNNGYYINDDFVKEKLEDKNLFIIYEPDSRALCVVKETNGKFLLITTYTPDKKGWFWYWLKENDYKECLKFKKYFTNNFEVLIEEHIQ